MRKWLLTFIAILCFCGVAEAQYVRVLGVAEQSGKVITSGINSTNTSSKTFPGATITIYNSGTVTLASIYSTSTGTSHANPYTASLADATYDFFIAPGSVFDVRVSGVSNGVTITTFTRSGYTAPGGVSGSTVLMCSGTNDTTLLTTASALGQQIIIPKGVTCASNTQTISAPLDIQYGGLLKPITGQTVTLTGPQLAGNWQTFTNATAGQGTISFTGNTRIAQVTLEWWGAAVDGATAEYPMFKAAVAAAPATGYTIFLTPGTHFAGNASSGLLFWVNKTGITVKGSGIGTTTVTFNSASPTATFGSGSCFFAGVDNATNQNVARYFTLSDLTIQDTSAGSSQSVSAVYAEGQSDLTVERIKVLNSKRQGITINGFVSGLNPITSNVIIRDNLIISPKYDAINFGNLANFQITGNYIFGVSAGGANGIEGGDLSTDGFIHDNTIDMNSEPLSGNGIGTLSGKRIYVTNNTIINCWNFGIGITADANTYPIQDIHIEHNTITVTQTGFGPAGILFSPLAGTSNSILGPLYITHNRITAPIALYHQNATTTQFITGNVFNVSQGRAIGGDENPAIAAGDVMIITENTAVYSGAPGGFMLVAFTGTNWSASSAFHEFDNSVNGVFTDSNLDAVTGRRIDLVRNLFTNSAAPSSPAAGFTTAFADSTDLRFHDKNSAGVIGTTVVADTGASNNFLTAISAAGVISKAQPSSSNLSDAANIPLLNAANTFSLKQTLTLPLIQAEGAVLSVSSNTITPTNAIHHVGAGLIKTITVPTGFTSGTIWIIPDSAFTYDGTSNIVLPAGGGTAVAGRTMSFTYSSSTSKWYPSY